jgi:mRNA interferase MazF
MARGDVLFIDLSPPPGGAGREQAGKRPAVAVQADDTGASLPTVIIVPMTSKLKALSYPHTIRVEPSGQNGLSQSSVLLVFQLRVIDRSKILRRLGSLEPHYLNQLDAEIRRLLDLEP